MFVDGPVEQGSRLRDWDSGAKCWHNGVFNINHSRRSPFLPLCVLACTFCSQAFTLIRQDQAGPMTSASMRTVVLVPAELCMQPHIPVHAHCYDEHLLGAEHTQLCCWLDVGLGTCGSLTAIQLLDWAASSGILRLAALLLD